MVRFISLAVSIFGIAFASVVDATSVGDLRNTELKAKVCSKDNNSTNVDYNQ